MKQITNLVILFALFLSFGCEKDDPEPAAPVLTFVDANLSSDSTFSTVRFEFFDADGDLGLRQNENSGDQEFNLFVDYYEKENGLWVLKTPIITGNANGGFDTTFLHLRVPFIENETGRELEGETSVNLFYGLNPDTFRYEIYLKDRALQESNRITTSELVLN